MFLKGTNFWGVLHFSYVHVSSILIQVIKKAFLYYGPNSAEASSLVSAM